MKLATRRGGHGGRTGGHAGERGARRLAGLGRTLVFALAFPLALALAFALGTGPQARAADPAKVLRVAMHDIATLDPQQYTDNPSFLVLRAIFEGLYEWDYLATPARLTPNTAVALPQISADGKVWTLRVKPGIHFTPDPAFKGRPRELVAADYVYSLKRWLDPNLKRGGAPIITDLIVGARPVIDAAARPGGRFDYDAPVAGLRALDRYTLQLRLTEPNYPIIESFLVLGAVAREVVEAAGGDIRARPVGTGPFVLREWQHGSRLVLDANPEYRSIAFPTSRDPRFAALERGMRGRPLPQLGRVEVSFIEEDVTRVLDFERGALDVTILRGETANRLLVDGRLRPEYAARGISAHPLIEPFLFGLYCNIADPVLGGMSTERVALRRAIALAFDVERLARIVYAGQALPANQLVPPGVGGHDPVLPPRPAADVAAARALLDRSGYARRDAEGWRVAPDGKPVTLTLSLRTGSPSREIQTQWKKDMDAINLRTEFRLAPFQDVIRELDAGQFQLYFGGYGGEPSGYAELMQLVGNQPPTVNPARFRFAAYDAAMRDFLRSPDDAGQRAAARRMSAIAQAYVPLLPVIFRIETYFVQPWVEGFAPPAFDNYWKYLDLAPRR